MLQNICKALGFMEIMLYKILLLGRSGGILYLTRGLRSVSQVGGVNSYSKIIKNTTESCFNALWL